MLGEVVKKGIIASTERHVWKEVEVTVDSGACETVMPKDECNHIAITESDASRRDVEYEVANGNAIPNLGQFVVETAHPGGRLRSRMQACNVTRPLHSVTKIGDQGLHMILTKEKAVVVDPPRPSPW